MRLAASSTPTIFVLAGTNGAGKSSVAGAAIRAAGAEYFNPDEAAQRIIAVNPGITIERANAEAWHHGKRLLEEAIAASAEFAFETTLGGRTMTEILERAGQAGFAVQMWYIGLDGPERHIARVRSRVAAGGHDIPEARIRERFRRSRENLLRLLPVLTELRLYDNSVEADPRKGDPPSPLLILHMADGEIRATCSMSAVPEWAKAIVMGAIRVSR